MHTINNRSDTFDNRCAGDPPIPTIHVISGTKTPDSAMVARHFNKDTSAKQPALYHAGNEDDHHDAAVTDDSTNWRGSTQTHSEALPSNKPYRRGHHISATSPHCSAQSCRHYRRPPSSDSPRSRRCLRPPGAVAFVHPLRGSRNETTQ